MPLYYSKEFWDVYGLQQGKLDYFFGWNTRRNRKQSGNFSLSVFDVIYTILLTVQQRYDSDEEDFFLISPSIHCVCVLKSDPILYKESF